MSKNLAVSNSARGLAGVLALFVQAENLGVVQASAAHAVWVDSKGVIRQATDAAIASRVLGILQRHELPATVDQSKDFVYLEHENAYVNTGLNNSLDREAGTGGTAVGYIGVSSNTTAVTAATVNLNGASGGAAANTIIKACTGVRSAQTTTYTVNSPFVNADFTAGVFVWNKVGLLTTSTDAGTGLVDVIGGTGGSSPYNRTFSLDLTGAGTFSVTLAIAVTATAV